MNRAAGAQQPVKPHLNLNGIRIFQNRALFEKRVLVERRVPGGYMNRWLVRELRYEIVIDRHFIINQLTGDAWCHPEVYESLVQQLGCSVSEKKQP